MDVVTGEGRATIGRAQGILMQRLGLRAESALQYLTSIATDSDRALVDVAREVVRSAHSSAEHDA